MQKLIHIFLLFIALQSCKSSEYGEYDNAVNTTPDYAIIPKPVAMEMADGRFLVEKTTTIYAQEGLQREADFLAAMLSGASGYTIQVKNMEDEGRGVFLTLDDSIENEEGYTLHISPRKIEIAGKNPKGVFYGMQSLRQLMPAQTEAGAVEKLSLPAVKIKDAPAYPYRGMHLDVCRHFFDTDFVKKYIDLIAMHKMNTFHWHLTEDQGWRIEIKKYPKLTEIGSVRKETVIKKNFDPYKGDGQEYGGFYTQEQIREVVAYATERHITVIPEIELPGHSTAALAAYPELGNGTGPYEVITKWGVFDQIYAPKEETFRFLEDVLTEVMALFPSEYIHIGGDEAPKKEWKESKQAQEVMKREGLKDEHELQSYFVSRIEKFLNDNGRQIIGWDEILEGGLAPNATVMSWRGLKGGIEAAKQGHDVIMTPGSHLYFDHYQAEPENEPFAIGGFLPVDKVYSFNPTPEELSPAEAKHILGAQANLWTEYIATPEQAEYMLLPRMSALAEVVWTPEEKKDWGDFKSRLNKLRERYDALGLNYGRHVFE